MARDCGLVNHCPKLYDDTLKIKMEHAYDPTIPLARCISKENEVSILKRELHAPLTAALLMVWMNGQSYG